MIGYFIGRFLLEPAEEFAIVREAFTYVTELEWQITVPEGFLTDGASVPRVFWSLFSPFDKRYLGAAIVHDYLYYSHQVTQIVADGILAEATVGAADEVRDILYNAVRLAGESSYESGPERQRQLVARLAAMGLS